MLRPRFGIVYDQESGLRPARKEDPVDLVVLRSCFLNPPRASGARGVAQRIRGVHANAELIPSAWHYLTHEPRDGITAGGGRILRGKRDHFGHLKETPEINDAWNVIKTCADGLGATQVLLHTPSSFSPGSLARGRFERFVRAHEGTRLVWQPTGLWSAAAAVEFAGSLGVEVVAPPLSPSERETQEESDHWIYIAGAKDAKMSGAQAEILADRLASEADAGDGSEDARATLLFAGPQAYANMRRFMREWDQLL